MILSLSFNFPDEIFSCLFLAVNNITGRDFKSLTDRDLKDLIPQFLQRKRLRDWMIGVVCAILYLSCFVNYNNGLLL